MCCTAGATERDRPPERSNLLLRRHLLFRVLGGKIGHSRIPIHREINLSRFERPMRNALQIEVREPFSNRAQYFQHRAFVDLFPGRLHLREVLPLDIFVRIENMPVRFARLIDRDDRRMLDMRLGPRVGDKARFGRIIALARRIENLQTDMAIDRNLDRGIGGAEAALHQVA